MLDVAQLRNLIIKPALQALNLFTPEAMELLVFTCANESDGGHFVHQLNGPALGIYQMEPNTYNDIWQNYINSRQDLKLQLLHNFNAPIMPDEDRMIYDLRFASAMCRIHYARVPKAIPELYDVDGLWNYYKTYYNSSAGKADYHQALEKYNALRDN